MTNALTIYGQFDEMQRAAIALHESGYFADSKSKAQAIVKVMAGAELGIPPFAAMTGIHIVQGKPALGANVLATLIKNDPRYNYRVLEMTADVCRIQFYENGEPCGISEFTIAEAKKAGTKNLDKFPKNMLFARAISNGSKWFTPGIFGGAPVYTPDELGADVDEEGNIIEGTAVVSHAKPAGTTETPDGYSMDFLNYCAANINRYSGNPFAARTALQKEFAAPPNGKPEAKAQFEWLKEHAAKRDAEEIEAAQSSLFDNDTAVSEGAYSEA
jgi:hypothetical protein